MISSLLLIAGVIVLSFALRGINHPLAFRLGTFGFLVATFLAGWLLAGNPMVGIVAVLGWFLLPWLEILTRVRRARLPFQRVLRQRTPPSRQTFPGFAELTEEIEQEGFEHCADTGWDWENYDQFFRLFYHAPSRTQAAICLVQQEDIAFFYISLSSRTRKGELYTTWNYPFSYGLKIPPNQHVHRVTGATSFSYLREQHELFLAKQGLDLEDLEPVEASEIAEHLQADARAQISHNLDAGLLVREGEEFIRYSFRGMFYLWLQFLRDFVRLQ